MDRLISEKSVMEVIYGCDWFIDEEHAEVIKERMKAIPSAEPTVAQERYEDLCEYFGGAKDILNNREDFKAWLGRIKWHIHKAEELYEKYEQEPKAEKVIKMRDATPEERESVANYIKSISKPTGVSFETPEQEPCEDAISRQAVDELSKELVHTTRDKADFLCNFWEGLQKLPPVTPQEPSITWVTGADGAKIAFKDVPVWKVTKICEILGEPQERSE